MGVFTCSSKRGTRGAKFNRTIDLSECSTNGCSDCTEVGCTAGFYCFTHGITHACSHKSPDGSAGRYVHGLMDAVDDGEGEVRNWVLRMDRLEDQRRVPCERSDPLNIVTS
jgi:hypothetical protein